MTYDGKYYTTPVYRQIDKYRIFYRDTGKYERNGEEQAINPLEFTKIASRKDREVNNLPPEFAYAKGIAEGKIITASYTEEGYIDKEIPKDEPVILLIDNINEDIVHSLIQLPKNVKGVITSNCEFCQLSHYANMYRNNLSVMSVIVDDDKYNELKKQEGKFISIDNQSGIVNWEEIKPTKNQIETYAQKIDIPHLENVNKLLTSEELTPLNCGNKGYRLHLMQELVKEGELKDIFIPNYFVIPEGYLNKVKEYIGEEESEGYWDKLFDGTYTQEVDKKVEELGMNRRDLIVRSNFNTEDLGSFSSAGIYNSQNNYDDNILHTALDYVVKRAYESEYTQTVHKKNCIKDSQIQPSVIVQDYISHKYEFTTYSDDGEDNAIIELIDRSMGYLQSADALIKYNKKTNEFNIERIESPKAEYLIDEQGKIIDSHQEENPISKNWNILTPLLGIVTSGALVLEKFFKHPQDIEGGITKDGKVWFWQTRDIVAKAVKKI